MIMNQATLKKLKQNPHYKPTPSQYVPDEEEEVKTFGVPPKVHTVPVKHPTGPKVVTN